MWDHPRPPRVVADLREVVVRAGGHLLACASRAVRVLETAIPPAFCLPPDDVARTLLEEQSGAPS